MANLHHGSWSYSTSATAQDLLPPSRREKMESLSPDQKLEELSSIFQKILRGSLDSSSDDISEDEDPGFMSTKKARKAALPCLSFSPVHALLLGLETFKEEILKCIVFGNISSDSFIEIFWDIVENENKRNWGTLAVYEAEKLEAPSFLVCFQNQLFEIKYIGGCDTLVTEYPKVTDASDDFLEDEENWVPEAVQEVVKMMKRGLEIRKNLEKFPAIRNSYSYIRRWVSIRGLAQDLPDTQIFKLLLEYQKKDPKLIAAGESGDPSSSALIKQFFEHTANKIDPLLAHVDPAKYDSFRTEEWENMLLELDSLSLSKKMDVAHIVQVHLTYNGVSQMKGAQWLLTVQRSLTEWKKKLPMAIPYKVSVKMWPQRLVQRDATPSDDVYEGIFVFGIQPLDTPLTDHDLEWIRTYLNDFFTSYYVDEERGDRFVRVAINDPSDLIICTKKWPRQVLTAEKVNDSDSDSDETIKKRRKPKPNTKPNRKRGGIENVEYVEGDIENMPIKVKANRFRPATEVLARLKFDQKYNLDEWVIGYMDRVRAKILEKPAADWDRDTTAEEFIPEHRIEYFKRYDAESKEGGVARGEMILWQKNAKLDRIFGKNDPLVESV
ncbi:hypothetical protein HYFRA_00012624 [Hymenoscyphus fraxineus]|uniref:MJ1316 RNA cyclic group end recognition domain-containing protein n=1 Tax=Hymenoscyphus fraxineus TaxID=746836 RepID=A0A9N9L663_9HELO|nr:hypothetical protein HYFRA_00012624 [Hymenoscyphus fraxineus]